MYVFGRSWSRNHFLDLMELKSELELFFSFAEVGVGFSFAGVNRGVVMFDVQKSESGVEVGVVFLHVQESKSESLLFFATPTLL